MIAIVNISKKYSRTGIQKYEVRINTKTITTFTHRSEEGLSVCLSKVGKAVALADANLLLMLIEDCND